MLIKSRRFIWTTVTIKSLQPKGIINVYNNILLTTNKVILIDLLNDLYINEDI